MNIFDEFDKLDAVRRAAETAPHPQTGEPGGSIWPLADANGALHNAFVRHGPVLLAVARAARRNAKNGLRIECRNECGVDGRSVCALCELNAALARLEGIKEDEMQCDHGTDKVDSQCSKDATNYCTGCECWRCADHDCECGTGTL